MTDDLIVSMDEARRKLGIMIEDMIAQIVSPDAPTTTNEHGGKQSDIPVRFDLIDGKALFEMAKVLDHGAKKYGANNWRLIDIDSHLNHLLMHTYAYLAGDRTDDHLSHILCRATFALGVALAEPDWKVGSDIPVVVDEYDLTEEEKGIRCGVHAWKNLDREVQCILDVDHEGEHQFR